MVLLVSVWPAKYQPTQTIDSRLLWYTTGADNQHQTDPEIYRSIPEYLGDKSGTIRTEATIANAKQRCT